MPVVWPRFFRSEADARRARVWRRFVGLVLPSDGMLVGVDPGAEEWIRRHVDPVGPIELVRDRLWATVMRVATADRVVWFKACAPVQAFEPQLSAHLFQRWPDRVAEVLAHDEDLSWLLQFPG